MSLHLGQKRDSSLVVEIRLPDWKHALAVAVYTVAAPKIAVLKFLNMRHATLSQNETLVQQAVQHLCCAFNSITSVLAERLHFCRVVEIENNINGS